MTSSAPGFYPDPADPAQLRYWDGARWTAQHHAAAPASSPSGVWADRAYVQAPPVRRAPPVLGYRWTFVALMAVFLVSSFAVFATPSGWEQRELPEWVTAEWDDQGVRVLPVDEDLTAALEVVLSLVEASEQVMLDFASVSPESDPSVVIELLGSDFPDADSIGSLSDLELAVLLAPAFRDALQSVRAGIAQAEVPAELGAVRAAYVEHVSAWLEALRQVVEDPEAVANDPDVYDNLDFMVQSSGDAFSLELVELVLSGRVAAEVAARAIAVLEFGFEGSQGLALYRFQFRGEGLLAGQWARIGDCLTKVTGGDDGDWEQAPCYDHHAEVVHVARAVFSGSRCPQGHDLFFIDDWGLYCTLVISDSVSLFGSRGHWGVGPLAAGNCVGFDAAENMRKTLCGRFKDGPELRVMAVTSTEAQCMTNQNYMLYESDAYIYLPAFDGARRFLCFDAVAWDRAGLPQLG